MSNYRITLRPLKSDIPPEVRLRRLLKIALRSCELRCENISIIGTDAGGPQSDEPRDNRKDGNK